MEKFKALIIDDERLARKELQFLLNGFPEIEVIGEAGSVEQAINLIENITPDVIFLDIQLRNENGFDLLEKTDIEFDVVFVTAYDEFAIRAFEINALDYLLKPVNPLRLKKTIERLATKKSTKEPETKQAKLNYDDNLILKINNAIRLINIKNIKCINAEGDYSRIITDDGKKGLILKSMKAWENLLPENKFIRIHRSTIINLDFVEKIEKWFNFTYRVWLKDIEDPYQVGRKFKSKFKPQ